MVTVRVRVRVRVGVRPRVRLRLRVRARGVANVMVIGRVGVRFGSNLGTSSQGASWVGVAWTPG